MLIDMHICIFLTYPWVIVGKRARWHVFSPSFFIVLSSKVTGVVGYDDDDREDDDTDDKNGDDIMGVEEEEEEGEEGEDEAIF